MPFVGALLVLLLAPSCGRKGPPLPPEPRGPNPPTALVVRQIGGRAAVEVTLGSPRGDKPAQQMKRVELIRVRYDGVTPPPPDPDAFRRRGVMVAQLDALESYTKGDVALLFDSSSLIPATIDDASTSRYAVRVLDPRGRPSIWVAAPDLVLLPLVAPATQLRAEPTAAGVRLRWDGESEFGFNLYRREVAAEPSLVPLNRSAIRSGEYLDDSVEFGKSYTYAVRVRLAEGQPRREGESSLAATVAAVDTFAPLAPERLVAIQEGLGVRLFWDPSPERDVAGYRVSRSVDEGPFVSLGDGLVARPLYFDASIEVGQQVRYRVVAVDSADPPNVSDPSETESLLVAPEPTGEELGDE